MQAKRSRIHTFTQSHALLGWMAFGLGLLTACNGSAPPATPTAPVLTRLVARVDGRTSTPTIIPEATSTPTVIPEETLTPAATLIGNLSSPTPTPLPPHPPDSLRGINVANSDSANIAPLKELGFTWVQTFLPPDYPVENFKVLYRLTLGSAVSGKPEDLVQFGAVVEGVAKQNGEFIDAYSIGNEVNLSREWGGQAPNPQLYAQLLAIAYARIKTYDPTAIVVSAGIAPTGGDGANFMDDLKYARAMLNAGAGNAFDAYGFHPYGFAYAPEQDPREVTTRNGLAFRRAELHRTLLEEYGLGNKKMWATEFGWLIDSKEEGVSCDLPEMNWQKVSRQLQADYAVRAFAYAKQNWAWMERMFLWNYDFSRSPLYPDKCEQMKWFSLLDEQGAPRPIVQALRQQ